MAQRHEPIAAWSAALFVALAIAAGFIPVAAQAAPQAALFDSYLLRVLVFTLVQAGLSTILSVAFAIPVALALSRHDFPGRAVLLRLFALPLAMPAIVAILGIVAVFGQSGWLGGLVDLYGLAGILIAHVFFNMPMAARFLLQRLEAVPPENRRLARALEFDAQANFRLIEWPLIASAIPGIASLVFLLCAASFAVVLTLGGGPQATTLEVAIYQSLRFDFDPARAAAFAVVQFALCGVLVMIARRYTTTLETWPRLRMARESFREPLTAPAALIIAAATAFIALPLAALAVAGFQASWTSARLLPALASSVAIALFSSAIALALAGAIAHGLARSRFAGLLGLAALATLIIPPAVLATGWFILSIKSGAQGSAGPALVVLLNALMALPFALGALAPAVKDTLAQNDRLCASLGLGGFERLRRIDLPQLKRPLALALAMCLIVSLGDLTAITLFGSDRLVTLPSLIHSQMGSYRLDEAAGTALVLLALAGSLIVFAESESAHDQA
jgi:thiamine transport system permease protein